MLPAAVALPCLPLSAHKARFRAKADKGFRDGQETGIAFESDLSLASRKLCEHAIFLCYFFRPDVYRNIFVTREMRRILKGRNHQTGFGIYSHYIEIVKNIEWQLFQYLVSHLLNVQ